MKKFAFIFGIVLIAAVLVGAGFWLGLAQHFIKQEYYVTELDKSLVAARLRASVLHDLDSGHIDKARSVLRSQLDSDILTIWAFGGFSDDQSRKRATRILAGIAAFRAESASLYTNRTTAVEAEIDARIASILEEARKAETK